MDEYRVGDRLLLLDAGNRRSVTIWEISPSGRYFRLRYDATANTVWLDWTEVLEMQIERLISTIFEKPVNG